LFVDAIDLHLSAILLDVDGTLLDFRADAARGW